VNQPLNPVPGLNSGSEDRLAKIFGYIFSESPFEDRRKVLDSFVANLLPEDNEIQADVFRKMKAAADKIGEIPSLAYVSEHLGYPIPISSEGVVNYADALSLIEEEIKSRSDARMSMGLVELSIKAGDLSPEDMRDQLSRLQKSLKRDLFRAETLRPADVYAKRKKLPYGPKTNIRSVDQLVGGVEAGTILTTMGFVGSFKTTFGMNFLYNNVVNLNYNMVFFTLEVPKELLILQLLSRHSYNSKFTSTHQPVESRKVQKASLTQEEEDFLFNVVEKDLQENSEYGKYLFVDGADFETIDVPGIEARLGFEDYPVDGLIVDYLQLFQYYPPPKHMPRGISVGDFYVREFAELSKRCNGKPISVLLLAQANREGYKRAQENEGRYDLLALSEFRELERSSSYVMSLYTDESLQESNEVKIMLLKNRFGSIMDDTSTAQVEPKYCVLGEEAAGYDAASGEEDVNDFLGLD